MKKQTLLSAAIWLITCASSALFAQVPVPPKSAGTNPANAVHSAPDKTLNKSGSAPVNAINSESDKPLIRHASASGTISVAADYFGEFREGLCAFKKGEKWGFMDTLGDIVLEPSLVFSSDHYDYPCYSNGLCFLPKGKEGNDTCPVFINRMGKEMVKNPSYREASPFCDGYAIAKTISGKFVYITRKGVQAFPSLVQQAGTATLKPNRCFSEGLSVYRDLKKNRYGFFNTSGTIVIPAQFIDAEDFKEGLAAVLKTTQKGERKWGFIDNTGATVIDFTFSNKPGNFSEGLSRIKDAKGKVGYIDKTGKVVIGTQYAGGYDFSDGMAFVFIPTKPFPVTINKAGDIIREIPVSKFELKVPVTNGFGVFSEGGGRSFGTIASDGTIILTSSNVDKEIIYKSIGEFHDGLSKCQAQTGNKMVDGFINKAGNFVIIRGE